MQGLSQAAQQLQSYGRGRDTMLAHISPDEAAFIDAIQGGRHINPMTGLPEYGLFGKILKSVVRVGGAIGGFLVGGPAGAAAGAGAATKLTGGSWKDALKAGAMSGIGSGLTQGFTGGGWSLTGAPSAGATGAGASGMSTGGAQGLEASLMSQSGSSLGASPGFYSGLSNAGNAAAAAGGPSGLAGLGAAAAPAAAPAAASGLSAALSPIGGYAGAAAGLGALSTPLSSMGGDVPLPPEGPGINLNVKPFQRGYRSPAIDLTKYAEGPGGVQFFENVNPEPEYLAHGGSVRHYNVGGGVMPMQQPGQGLGGLAGLHNPSIPSQIESPHFDNPMQLRAMGRDMSPGAQRAKIRQAAMFGYVNAKDGGRIKGPGTETSDSIPAMLSQNEHVIDAGTVRAAGGGSADRGHKEIEKWKRRVRARSGVKNPKKPPAFQGRA